MENQESIKQAAATSEYFTLVIRRKPVRLQTRMAEKTANRLNPSASAVTKFISTRYLSQAEVGGIASLPPKRHQNDAYRSKKNDPHQRCHLVVHGNQRVPGCGEGRGLWPMNIRRPWRMRGATTTARRTSRLATTAVSTGPLCSYQGTRCN